MHLYGILSCVPAFFLHKQHLHLAVLFTVVFFLTGIIIWIRFRRDNISSGVTACSLSWTTPVLLFSLSMLTFCKNSAQAKMIFRSSLYQIIILVTKARVHQIKYHSIRCLPSNNTPAVFESSSISLICIASLPPLATMMELKLEVILVITTMELKLEVIIINPPPPFLCNIVERCWENWCCDTTVRWGGIPQEGRRPKLSSRRTSKRMKLQ